MVNNREFLEQVRYHHLRLQLLMRAIREVLTCRATHVAREPPHSAMLVLLANLNHELADHFALEERNGYFTEVKSIAPRLSRRLDELSDDHLRFLERARELLELAGKAVSTPKRWQSVATGLGELLTRIDAHEHAENELFQSAFTNDLGGSG